VPGIKCDGPVGLLLATVVFMVLSSGVGMVSGMFPLAALGPGFTLVGILISVAVLWVVGQIVPGYEVDGLGSAVIGGIVISLAQFAAGVLFMVSSVFRTGPA
jgi:uncharacterized membrane protein YvlD (DUF360 family)